MKTNLLLSSLLLSSIVEIYGSDVVAGQSNAAPAGTQATAPTSGVLTKRDLHRHSNEEVRRLGDMVDTVISNYLYRSLE
ncbi:hypothetical protein [Candidatus Bodocaedibacter vickermanii]|uniref:Uncharacterized protein n=1 Tax=Candidatus Bodocaedibacter vickermanii TaxID=2741701 RepID=A0A7L9RUM0_9PROT|nr:hypothetical protein CPBP_01050 [Candidatus Paracaedibacteraceae bacterium 'Lake Konstanz']